MSQMIEKSFLNLNSIPLVFCCGFFFGLVVGLFFINAVICENNKYKCTNGKETHKYNSKIQEECWLESSKLPFILQQTYQ